MKNMTFNFAVAIILVVKIIEFMCGVFGGVIYVLLNYNLYKFEENSFLKKVYHWISDHPTLCGLGLSIIGDVISAFVVLPLIF